MFFVCTVCIYTVHFKQYVSIIFEYIQHTMSVWYYMYRTLPSTARRNRVSVATRPSAESLARARDEMSQPLSQVK